MQRLLSMAKVKNTLYQMREKETRCRNVLLAMLWKPSQPFRKIIHTPVKAALTPDTFVQTRR